MKALVVEDTATGLALVCRALEKMGITPIGASDGLTGVRLFEEHRPDMVLLDIILPDIDGFEVARRIRAIEQAGDWAPIIFLTGRTKDEDLKDGIAAGGDDYIFKPVSQVVLGAKLSAMRRIVGMRHAQLTLTRRLDAANRELKRLSAVDELTSIPNRRQFDESLRREWRRCSRDGKPMALLMCDVDGFKQFNDTYGHPAGDACLIAVAETLSGRLRRPADVVARYGGEEFGAILPETSLLGALQVAEGMRAAVEEMHTLHLGSSLGYVTISIGVAMVLPQLAGGEGALVASADWALYEAKRLGKNRVHVAEMPQSQ